MKFHWTPALGTHSLVWDEAQKISGKDPDFNRRDLWEAIEAGDFPQWELGVQLIPQEQAFAFDDIDLLDATKLIPEELVPVTPVGRLTLNRNPDNFFAETEQVAFCVGNVVPGIDFTDDPLLQARLFSYLDTQLTRLGGPNFAQLPINRPHAPVRNHQQDGFHQQRVPPAGPTTSPTRSAAAARLGGAGLRALRGAGRRAQGTQAQRDLRRPLQPGDPVLEQHVGAGSGSTSSAAYRFELGKVATMAIRVRMVEHLNRVDHDLAVAVAAGIGVEEPGQVRRQPRPRLGRAEPGLTRRPAPSPPARSRSSWATASRPAAVAAAPRRPRPRGACSSNCSGPSTARSTPTTACRWRSPGP